MRTAITILMLLWCNSALCQAPILYDADDLPIGRVISIIPTGNQDHEHVVIMSEQGYRAKMGYMVGAPSEPYQEGIDLPGYSATQYFDSTDCTGDPIVIPTAALSAGAVIENDLSNVWEAIQLAKAGTSGLRTYANGDLFEMDGQHYFVPYDAQKDTIEVKSVNLGFCWAIDRCDTSSVWDTFTFALTFSGYFTPDGEYHEASECPNISEYNRLEIEKPIIVVTGFRLSSVEVNNPSITGFESIKYRPPYRVGYEPIKKSKKD